MKFRPPTPVEIDRDESVYIDLDALKAGEESAHNIYVLPVGSRGVPTLEQQFQKLRRSGNTLMPLVISTPPMIKSSDVPYLEREIEELEQFLENNKNLESVFANATQALIEARKRELLIATQQESDQTAVIRVNRPSPKPKNSPHDPEDTTEIIPIAPNTGVRGWFRRILGEK